MQPQSESNSLEASWRVPGVSLHGKTEEAAVRCPWVMAIAIDTLAQE